MTIFSFSFATHRLPKKRGEWIRGQAENILLRLWRGLLGRRTELLKYY